MKSGNRSPAESLDAFSGSKTGFVKRSSLRQSSGVTPEQVVNKRFAPTNFREGYSENSVDDFLDTVVIELRRLSNENESLKLQKPTPTKSPLLTPEDVVNHRFVSTKFRGGYDQDDVDDFLDEIVVELRRLTAENVALRIQAVHNAE